MSKQVIYRHSVRARDRKDRDLYAKINGLLTSHEVRKIRKKLKLTQKDAARICGGGPNAFSRYERGEATPLRATSNLLRLMAKYPKEVQYLLKFST
jgi:HTH-type transcriptional regulator/antitoxin MqsA